jgi:NHLM bacteriocin system ABC transporter ATP-binding protein
MHHHELMVWLRRLLGASIREVPVQGDQPLVLDDPTVAYVTLSEHHELFSLGSRSDGLRGRREHLTRCCAGQLLLGIEARDAALLLSGISGSVVWSFPVSRLLALREEEEGCARIAQWLDGWVALLLATLPSTPLPAAGRAVRAGRSFSVEPTRALYADAGQVLWVAPSTPITYCGRTTLTAPSTLHCWPLTDTAFLTCASERLTAWTSRELLASKLDLGFADAFHALVLQAACERRAAAHAERAARETRSQTAEVAEVEASLRALAVTRSDPGPGHENAPGETLTAALRYVCEWLEFDPQARVALPQSAPLHQLQAALDRTPHLRTRPVQLEPRFWEHDAGPLLAFVLDSDRSHHPVALLPSRCGYQLHDPRIAKPIPLDAAMSAQLHHQAYQVYRTLPAGPLGIRQLLQFSSARTTRDFALVALVGLVGGLLSSLVPLLTGVLFDRIIPSAERGLLLQLALVLLGIHLGSLFLELARGYALVRVRMRMDTSLEAAVWDRVLSLPLRFFRDYSAGELAARAKGLGTVRELLFEVAVSSLLASIFSSWNLGLLLYLDLKLALAALALVVTAAAVASLAAYFELRRRRQLAELDGRIHGLLLQLFTGIAKLRASGSERRAFVRWARLFSSRRDAVAGGERIGTRLAVFQSAFPLLCSMALYFLVFSNGYQSLSTGEFLAFSAAFSVFLRAILDLIGAGLQTLQAIPLYERAKPILIAAPESHAQGDTAHELQGAIALSQVSFRYERSAPLVLDELELRIEPGQFVAIVGASGSGKSTLLRILLGFEAPTEGCVRYDGQTLTSLNLRAVRKQIGVVLQHSQVVPGDIYSNIVGSSTLTVDDAWRAARLAALDRDIEALPMGMHTVITPGGSTLSGGQRQRLLLARALAHRPRILLLDEATSALDNHTQAAVRQNLDDLRITRIVIAHRLSTIRNADKIVVLERGRIVEVGGYDAVLRRGDAFAQLTSRQLL